MNLNKSPKISMLANTLPFGQKKYVKKGFNNNYPKKFKKYYKYKTFYFYFLKLYYRSVFKKLEVKENLTVLHDEPSQLSYFKKLKRLMVYFRLIKLNQAFLHYYKMLKFSAVRLSLLANQLYGLNHKGYKKPFWRFNSLKYRFFRDNQLKDLVDKKSYQHRKANKFWLPLDKKPFDFFYWKKMRYFYGKNPFIYILKKYKMFFNWGDRFLFKRYPLYRRKYPVLYYYPKFQDYRKLFKHQIREQQFFRWLYRLKYKQLVKKFKKAVFRTRGAVEKGFLNYYEMRLDTMVYRLNFAFSLKQAKQWVNRSFFLVNEKNIGWYTYHVSLGDVILPIVDFRTSFLTKKKWVFAAGKQGFFLTSTRLFYRYIQADQYNNHFMINERIPAGLVVSLPDPTKIRHNRMYSIQFLTLSLNKYS